MDCFNFFCRKNRFVETWKSIRRIIPYGIKECFDLRQQRKDSLPGQDAKSLNQNRKFFKPEAKSLKPNRKFFKPEAKSFKQNRKSFRPEAKSLRSEAKFLKPEANSFRQNGVLM
jgi:uncharacterized coiled-coil DUF342 family protein